MKIYGTHAVLAALQNKRRAHKELITTQYILNEVKQILDISNIKTSIKTPKELDILCPNGVHQNIILLTSPIITADTTCLKTITQKEYSVIIALDQVTDPQNVGAIIRSALAFGVDAILLPEHNSPDETPALVKASSGAIEKMPVIKIKNLSNTMKMLKEHGYWVIGLDSNARTTIDKISFDKKIVLIFGSEGKGPRRLTQENCDLLIKLPTTDLVESLNVSNAASIAMYEVFKRPK